MKTRCVRTDEGLTDLNMPVSSHGKKTKRRFFSKTWSLVVSSFLFLCLFIWLNEVLDLPYVFFGGQKTPINWQEALAETAVITIVVAIVLSIQFMTRKKMSVMRKNYIREKVFSDILIQESPTFFTAIDPEGKTIMMNNAMLMKLGYTQDEVVGTEYLSTFIPPREQELMSDVFFNLVQYRNPTRHENYVTAKDGTEYLVEWEGRAVFKESGEIDFIYGAGVDITEREKAESALRESEGRYRSFAQNFQGIAFRAKMDYTPVFLHGTVQEITGYSEQEFIAGKPNWKQIIHPEDLDKMIEETKPLVSSPSYATELTYRIIRKDGQVRWLHEYVQNICGATGNPEEVQGMVYDITKNKEAEDNLMKSDERYRLLAENVQDVIWVLDKDLHHTYISPSVLRFRGYTVEEAMSMPLDKIFTYESYERLMDLMQEYIALQQSSEPIDPNRSLTVELEQICKDGSTIWTEVTANFVLDTYGRPDGFVGITRNITERKKAEESLKESEERYRTIFENTGTAMAIIEEDVTISLANSEFQKLSGFPRQSIEHKKYLIDFVSDEHRDRILNYHKLRRIDPGAAPRNYEFKFVDKDGNTKDVFVTANIIPGTGKSVTSLLDITDMKKTEENLMRSREQLRNLHKHAQDVREGERTRVAREIHDELGQVLTALKMDLSFLAKKFPENLEPLHTKANLMLKFIDMTIQSVKRITMDLRPGLLDHLGLVPAIEWQAEEFQNRTGISCTVHVDPDDIQMDKDVATTIFRIFQETLTNVARHADASSVETSLKEQDGRLELIVKDNGKGITKKQIYDSKSFGLMGIKERAYFCGGEVTFSGEKGKGTTVVVSIPIEDKGGS
ncbi:MAG TPA: PAS domain S-box protein [Deltaproteobacteria bacterium]|nr:PAS domain S-box protein [Deltaproteobacteria bacterium]